MTVPPRRRTREVLVVRARQQRVQRVPHLVPQRLRLLQAQQRAGVRRHVGHQRHRRPLPAAARQRAPAAQREVRGVRKLAWPVFEM